MHEATNFKVEQVLILWSFCPHFVRLFLN